MAVIRRNPNKKPKQEPTNITLTPNFRQVRRVGDGSVKTIEPNFAARLVAKGLYTYADGGPDESANLPRRKKFLDASNKPSDILHLAKIPQLETTGEGEMYTGPSNVIRSDSFDDYDTTVPTLPPNPNRKIIKKSDIPKEKLNFILQSNTSNPAKVETSRSAGDLKGIIDKVRKDRNR